MTQSHRARGRRGSEPDAEDLVVARRTYTVAEVAQILGVSEALVYKQAQVGKLPGAVRLGDTLRVNRAALDRLAAGEGGSLHAETRTTHAA